MENADVRVIPGYEGYAVSQTGAIISIERGLLLSQYFLNGYLIVDTFRGSRTETLPVHRAVALAWLENPDPEKYNIVNHIDGDKMFNWCGNLEWTDYSGNNYHAVASNVRSDNIPCLVRDFRSGVVSEFPSMAQAAEFMGLRKDTGVHVLCPKMFGKLIADQFEFRFANDQTPWFYESRKEMIKPARYMVTVESSDGTKKEVYSTKALLQDYRLYDCPGRSIPALAEFGNKIYPDKRFTVRDSYTEERFRQTRNTRASVRTGVIAVNGSRKLNFESLTQCARYFNVDRFRIVKRLDNGRHLDGWTFISS